MSIILSNLNRFGLRNILSSNISFKYSTQASSEVTKTTQPVKEEPKGELDDLFKRVIVEVRGHEPSVLNSYTAFVQQASNHLGINLFSINTPHRFIERWTLLKSRFGNRKHMRQYEMRTHFKVYEFKHLTGSTCDTLLEYIQRNLPEGVAMHVHKTKIMPIPDHFTEEKQHNTTQE